MKRALDFLREHNEVALATVGGGGTPTPPLFLHFDLKTGQTATGFVGERFSGHK